MAKEDMNKFYQSAPWRRLSNAVRTGKLYTCERCGDYGSVVHHIKYITPHNINNPDITLNKDNLMLLCNECHNKIHKNKRENKSTADGYKFTADGDIVSEHTSPP